MQARAIRPAPATSRSNGKDFFKQLTAERLIAGLVGGFPRGPRKKEPGRRNQALDRPGPQPGRGGDLRERHW